MYHFLQQYWWAVVSLLGALLVFMMFVQGGQSLLLCSARTKEDKDKLVYILGHKWGITFTTLVTFGGAAFASFPLFYSTSFGGAYWLWIAILLLFVLQAVSYEFRDMAGNIFGSRTFEILLFFNGFLGTILIGVAVGMFYTGGDFSMHKLNITDISSPIISQWGNGWHGLEAIANPLNLLLGFIVFLGTRTLGLLYVIDQHDGEEFRKRARFQSWISGLGFVALFVIFLICLFLRTGYGVDPETGEIFPEKYKYFHNMIEMIWPLILLLLGVVFVLFGLGKHYFGKGKYSFFITGAGVILAVWAILIVAAFNNTAYLVSTQNIQQSLTLYNSSSSEFTLRVMAWVSLAVPFVIWYIGWTWKQLRQKKSI